MTKRENDGLKFVACLMLNAKKLRRHRRYLRDEKAI